MDTENTSGEESQPQGESSQSNESFNLDNIIQDLLPQFEESQTEQPAAQEAGSEQSQEAQSEDVPPQETEAEPQETLLSAKLAEKARREREERAAREDFEKSKEQLVADARSELVRELTTDPQAFITKYGIENVGDLAMHFYAADLGEDAPDDLKQQIGLTDLERFKQEQTKQLAQLRQEMAQQAEMARNQAVLDQYSGFLSEVPADLPYLQVEAQHDQHEALKAMAQVADVMHDRTGKYPSANEVAKLINDEIEQQAARYKAIGQKQPNVEPTQTVKPVETAPKTLSTDNSGKSAKKLPVGEDELFEDAFELYKELTGQ